MPKLLGRWDKSDEIDFNSLPQRFILKTNNGCAQCVIVDKSKDNDFNRIRLMFAQWLQIPYGWSGAQLHYTRIRPCIIAEELLQQSEEERRISPSSLIDYKVWCFNGRPQCIWVAYNRRMGKYVDMALYNTSWIPMPQFLKSNSIEQYRLDISIPKPKCLDLMLELASKLSAPFPEVRVDFYIIDANPVVGEMTFTSGYGYFTDEYYNYLGGLIDLNRVKKIK